VRFQVTQVMDAIEQRLTTDVTLAQAVVDLGQVVRDVELDQGRPVSLVRIGMVVDALSRHLVDGGAMLYGVAERALLSEPALTSKERMVLGRWADDGLIEVVPVIGDRVVEIADVTGLPVIAVSPYRELAGRYGWLANGAGRVLTIGPRAGVAVLCPVTEATANAVPDSTAIGRARVPERVEPAREPAESTAEPVEPEPVEPEPVEPEPVERAEPAAAEEAEPAAAEADSEEPGTGTPEATDADSTEAGSDNGSADAALVTEAETDSAAEAEIDSAAEAEIDSAAEADTDASAEADTPAETGTTGQSGTDAAADETADIEPVRDNGDGGGAQSLPVVVFANRGVLSVVRTRISWRRFGRAEPNPAHATLLGRQWRCDEFDCPVFGEHRRIGQPVPRLRDGVPVCPRHDRPVVDIGQRGPSYPVSIVVDELPRQRLVVRSGRPVSVGRAAADPDDPDLVSVASWLHQAAAAWISERHVRLEAGEGGLTVTDASENGTMVWLRTGPDGQPTVKSLRGESHLLGEWDSVELYTGIALMHADRRLAAVLGRDELGSVLLDAPTAAHRLVSEVST
jgi:hypothetical protein